MYKTRPHDLEGPLAKAVPQFSPSADANTHTVCMRPTRTKRSLTLTKTAGVDLGISLCRLFGRIYVADVYPGTKAWTAGMQVGDRLETLQGEDIPLTMKAADIMTVLREADQLVLDIEDSPLLSTCVVETTPALSRRAEVKTTNLGFKLCQGKIQPDREAPSCFREHDRVVSVDGKWVFGKGDEKIMNYIASAVRKNGRAEISTIPDKFAQEVQLCIKSRPSNMMGHWQDSLLIKA